MELQSIVPLLPSLLLLSFLLPAVLSIPTSSIPNPSLYPHTSNGYLGVVTNTPALYVKSLFTRELEWLEAACLSLSSDSFLSKILNPLSRYELSGVCGWFDSFVKEKHPGLDVVERGYGARKARLPNPFAYDILGVEGEEILAGLDDETATSSLSTNSTTRTFYAHSSIPNLYVHTLTAKAGTYHFRPITFKGLPEDVTFDAEQTFETPQGENYVCKTGHVNLPEQTYPSFPAPESYVAICHHALPSRLHIPSGETQTSTFLYAVETSSTEISFENCASILITSSSDPTSLRSSHVESWSELSSPTIRTSNSTLNGIIMSTLTSLRSSMNPSHPYPPSPGGTSTNGYFGLFFWDSDLWISSSLLLMNPNLSLQSSLYRADHIESALKRATDLGHSGCMVPWQSGGSGHDMSLAPFANEPEQHVTSAAVLLMENLDLSNPSLIDNAGYRDKFNDMIMCAANFWMGRVDDDGSINGVIGPDEFGTGGASLTHSGVAYKGVKDNPYTNIGARRVLEYAFKLFGKEEHKNAAEAIRVLYDSNADIHPQYVDFPLHQNRASKGKVKQADVTMMAWPYAFEYETPSTLLNDLDYYAAMYDEDGPAMTASISTIAYLAAGNVEDAKSNFLRQLDYVQTEQFNIWTETPDPEVHPSDMGCYNFLTGAGGFVQSMVHGWGGMRLKDGGLLEFRLQMEEGLFTELAFEGFVFGKNKFDIRGDYVSGAVEIVVLEGDGFKVLVDGEDKDEQYAAPGKPLELQGCVGKTVQMQLI